MENVLPGVVGALTGLAGVLPGTWPTGRGGIRPDGRRRGPRTAAGR
ncbi:hypothetical protein [Streptomyces sp. WAC 06738]|nr:hypothetical protein [Streptomyces sp. WAC 06738]